MVSREVGQTGIKGRERQEVAVLCAGCRNFTESFGPERPTPRAYALLFYDRAEWRESRADSIVDVCLTFARESMTRIKRRFFVKWYKTLSTRRLTMNFTRLRALARL